MIRVIETPGLSSLWVQMRLCFTLGPPTYTQELSPAFLRPIPINPEEFPEGPPRHMSIRLSFPCGHTTPSSQLGGPSLSWVGSPSGVRALRSQGRSETQQQSDGDRTSPPFHDSPHLLGSQSQPFWSPESQFLQMPSLHFLRIISWFSILSDPVFPFSDKYFIKPLYYNKKKVNR